MVIKLFGERIVSVYGLLGVGGFIAGIIALVILCKIKKLVFDDAVYVYVWAGIMAVVGAKALYLLLDIKNIIEAFQRGGDYLSSYLKAIFGGGLVFYGGMAGGIMGVFLASRYFKLDFRTMLTTLIPTLPLAHAFGRFGCHTVGCCYGVPVRGHIGKMYTDSLFAPNNVLLFPVQLTESLCDLVIFGVLTFLIIKTPGEKMKESNLPEIYLIMYSVVRFILEFYRGDAVRGHFLIFSTSQWISIVIIIAAILSIIIRRRILTQKIH